MRRIVIGGTVLLFAGVSPAAGQSPVVARVQIGGHAAAVGLGDLLAVHAGPRITFQLTSRTAVDVVAEWGRAHDRGLETRSTRLHVQIQQTLFAAGRVHVFAGAGAGLVSQRVTVPEGWMNPSQPGFTFRHTNGSILAGAGFEYRLASRLTLRADAQALFMSGPIVGRLAVGLGIPFGRIVRERVSVSPLRSPSAAAPALMAAGQQVWITMKDGTVHHGTVTSATPAAVEVKEGGRTESLAFGTIQRIETGARSMVRRSAIIGGLAGAVPMGIYMSALCRSEGCSGSRVAGFTALAAGAGASIGALVGAVIDGFRQPRRVIYEAPVSAETPGPADSRLDIPDAGLPPFPRR